MIFDRLNLLGLLVSPHFVHQLFAARWDPDVPGPDPKVGEAALRSSELGREALDFYKQEYWKSAPQRARASDIATAVSENQLKNGQIAQDIVKDTWDYQRQNFRPLEQKLIGDSYWYDSPERQNKAAGEAGAAVMSSMAQQRDAMKREAIARGINPDSGSYMANLRKMAVSEGAAVAAAQNRARENVEQQGYARRMDAASLGRNLASNQSTQQQVANQTNNSAVTNAQVPSQISQNATSGVGDGYRIGMAGNTGAAQILNQQYQNQVSASNARSNVANTIIGGVGSIASGLPLL